jgi:hypothetical protein
MFELVLYGLSYQNKSRERELTSSISYSRLKEGRHVVFEKQ